MKESRPLAADWLVGGGEMGALIRAKDWSSTPLGPIDTWPQSLRSAVSILLPSKAQIVLFWGPELVAIYNDAYRPVFGSKHPAALGMPARQCWSEVWDVLEPLFQQRRQHRRGVLGQGSSVRARAPRLRRRNVLRRFLRPGAGRNRPRRRPVLHRQRDHRAASSASAGSRALRDLGRVGNGASSVERCLSQRGRGARALPQGRAVRRPLQLGCAGGLGASRGSDGLAARAYRRA